MKLLKSKRITLPDVYFITDRKEIAELPIGVPFIHGDPYVEKHIVRMLEYEVLYKEAVKSGYPFDFRKILKEKGYKDLKSFGYDHPIYMDYTTNSLIEDGGDWDIDESKSIKSSGLSMFQEYLEDAAVYVNVEKLKGLNIFPVWMDIVEEAVSTNIHNFAVFNDNMYNKKLEGMYGGVELSSPNKNLIIIDISGSIPKGVSSTCLALAKNLVETFYADLLITGSKSILYDYSEVHDLDIETIYEMGMNNDQKYFKGILTKDTRHYNTAIVFGDNDHPGYCWNNDTSRISDEDGKRLCQWEIDNLVSFHTSSSYELAGYARWFDVKEKNIKRITDWVEYLN